MNGIIHQTGHEWMMKCAYGDVNSTQFYIGLLYDPNLEASDDIPSVQSEVDNSGAYNTGPYDISLIAPEYNSVHEVWSFSLPPIQFDVTDNTEIVDGYYFATEFQAEGESSQNKHLIFSGHFDNEVDLEPKDSLTVENGGVLYKNG